MDSIVIQQMFRELVFMAASVVCAYFFVGGFIFLEEHFKRVILQSAKQQRD
jgi:hypothetical protein